MNKKNSRPQDRSNRSGKSGWSERSGRSDKRGRTEKSSDGEGSAERPDSSGRHQWARKSGPSRRSGKSGWSDRSGGSENRGRSGKPSDGEGSAERPDSSGKHQWARKSGPSRRSGKSGWSDRSGGSENRGRTGKPSDGEGSAERPDSSGKHKWARKSGPSRRSGKSGWSDRSGGSDNRGRTEKPERSGRTGGTDKPDRKESSRQRSRQQRPDFRKGKKRSHSGTTAALPDRVAQREYLEDEIRLNKYIAHAGFCSRRDADDYISAGKVIVNGKTVTELGVKVKPTDKVTVDGQSLSLEPFIYILLNKDKNTISTTDDEKDRRTVMDAIESSTGHRVYPVGRLDRNTTGLILLTNDGDLAHRLMHPSYKVKKTYEVVTDRVLTEEELQSLREGVTLEDGPVRPTSVKPDPGNPYIITVTIHEGRNHLVRRMIGYTGAEVTKLKRIRYGGLNAKLLRVDRWRYLKNKEVNQLRKLVKLEPLDFNQENG